MTDQLFLSIWLDRTGKKNRLRQFEKLLRLFPFSQREQPQSVTSILAINNTEPPLLERPVTGPVEIDQVLATFADYNGDDVAYTLESWWDLWVYDEDWKLTPTRVLLSCFGADFDNGSDYAAREQEDLRIDFGVDSRYLPDSEIAGSARLVASNVTSLLRVVHEADATLHVARRQLQTESGKNFAEHLEVTLRSQAAAASKPN
ncbi:MAG TPA: hypothetical protein VH351_06660 [Bryobacteraceae bacterium]|nr:hypothetical protein [Bryobacteraceae bacterium]